MATIPTSAEKPTIITVDDDTVQEDAPQVSPSYSFLLLMRLIQSLQLHFASNVRTLHFDRVTDPQLLSISDIHMIYLYSSSLCLNMYAILEKSIIDLSQTCWMSFETRNFVNSKAKSLKVKRLLEDLRCSEVHEQVQTRIVQYVGPLIDKLPSFVTNMRVHSCRWFSCSPALRKATSNYSELATYMLSSANEHLSAGCTANHLVALLAFMSSCVKKETFFRGSIASNTICTTLSKVLLDYKLTNPVLLKSVLDAIMQYSEEDMALGFGKSVLQQCFAYNSIKPQPKATKKGGKKKVNIVVDDEEIIDSDEDASNVALVSSTNDEKKQDSIVFHIMNSKCHLQAIRSSITFLESIVLSKLNHVSTFDVQMLCDVVSKLLSFKTGNKQLDAKIWKLLSRLARYLAQDCKFLTSNLEQNGRSYIQLCTKRCQTYDSACHLFSSVIEKCNKQEEESILHTDRYRQLILSCDALFKQIRKLNDLYNAKYDMHDEETATLLDRLSQATMDTYYNTDKKRSRMNDIVIPSAPPRKRKKLDRRSRNSFVDEHLPLEEENDTFEDLEDFVVCSDEEEGDAMEE